MHFPNVGVRYILFPYTLISILYFGDLAVPPPPTHISMLNSYVEQFTIAVYYFGVYIHLDGTSYIKYF